MSDEIRNDDSDTTVDAGWPTSLETVSPARAVDEGVMIALTAIRMAVKNRIIVGALRDRATYNPEAYIAAAREEITTLARQNDDLATRLENRALAHAERMATRAALVAEQNARSAERDARAADKDARLAAEKEARASARQARRGTKLALRPRTTAPSVATPPATTPPVTTPAVATPPVTPTPVNPEPEPTPSTPDIAAAPDVSVVAPEKISAESQRSELLRQVYVKLAADLRAAGEDSQRLADLVESARQDAWSEVRQAWHAKLAEQSPTDVGADYDRHREGRLLELVYIDLAALRHDAKRRLRKNHK